MQLGRTQLGEQAEDEPEEATGKGLSWELIEFEALKQGALPTLAEGGGGFRLGERKSWKIVVVELVVGLSWREDSWMSFHKSSIYNSLT